MAVSSEQKNIIYRASYIGIFFFVAWGVLLVYLGTYAPTVSDEAAGRIYTYNYHGTIVYLTFTQHVLRYALPGAGFLIFFVLLIIDRYQKKKDKRWPPDDIYGDI
jgi:TRAP-type C4-dicarboxylate transport system permease small subunit